MRRKEKEKRRETFQNGHEEDDGKDLIRSLINLSLKSPNESTIGTLILS